MQTCNIGMEPAMFRSIVMDGLRQTNYRYIAMRIRTDAAITEPLRSHAEINLDYLIRCDLAGRFRFVTPDVAVRFFHG